MRAWLLLIAFVAACQRAPERDVIDEIRKLQAVTLDLALPSCLVTAPELGFTFTATADADGEMTLEITDATGKTRVLLREDAIAGESVSLSLPPGLLSVGENRVVVSHYSEARAPESKAFFVSAFKAVRGSTSLVDSDGDCFSASTGDCDESNSDIHPGAVEICSDGIDNNCNEQIDFGEASCAALCEDFDGDGARSARCGGTDCNDDVATTSPSAIEMCDGVDNNCNGMLDETFDEDLDGFVDCGTGGRTDITWRTDGSPCPATYATCSDCDDQDDTTFPDAFEPCDDKLHSCRGSLADKTRDDDGDTVLNCEDPDNDNDGVCDPGITAAYAGLTACPADTADGSCCRIVAGGDNCRVARNATQSDIDGDNIGDACDGCSDADADSYGRSGTFDRNGALTATGAAIGHPPGAPQADDDTFVTLTCRGNPDGADDRSDVDCNDGSGGIRPGASEACNGIDDDCDGTIDEGFDADGDGYNTCGSYNPMTMVYAAPNIALEDCADCTTANCVGPGVRGNQVKPGANESCNGVDDDCDGTIDENFDADADTFTTCGNITNTRTNGLAGGKDCNDCAAANCVGSGITGAALRPNATEVCNGADDDCDGTTDEGFDQDSDGYTTCGSRNGPGTPFTASSTPNTARRDCADTGTEVASNGYTLAAASINPGQRAADAAAGGAMREFVCDGIDNDCSRAGASPVAADIDEGCDDDNDNHCDLSNNKVINFSPPPPTCTATISAATRDCDDANMNVSPALPDTECNGLDNNCNGLRDEGNDADGDTYVACTGATYRTTAATGCPATYTTCSDCDDSFAAVYPSHAEVCFNGYDDDCDGPAVPVTNPLGNTVTGGGHAWKDADDGQCCASKTAVMITRTSMAAIATEDFESYNITTENARMPNITGASVPLTPASTGQTDVYEYGTDACILGGNCPNTNIKGGWERINFHKVCADASTSDFFGTDTAPATWRVTTSSYAGGIDFGEKVAGCAGNANGDNLCVNAFSAVDCAENSALVSPPIDFATVSAGIQPTDLVLVEYQRFSRHDLSGGPIILTGGYNNICERTAAYDALAGDDTDDLMPPLQDDDLFTPVFAPFYTQTGGDERCDMCRDGEYFGLAAHDSPPAPWSAASPPITTLGGFSRITHDIANANRIQCFMDATFGPPAGVPVPLSYDRCPLSARLTDHEKWRWVYAEIPRAYAQGHPRFFWRLNTLGADITAGDENGNDEGLYIDDVSFLVCRPP